MAGQEPGIVETVIYQGTRGEKGGEDPAAARFHYNAVENGIIGYLAEAGQVVLRYRSTNPNGSVADIAGIYNRNKNVLGMMPHPERASEAILGNDDGLALFQSLRRHLGLQ